MPILKQMWSKLFSENEHWQKKIIWFLNEDFFYIENRKRTCYKLSKETRWILMSDIYVTRVCEEDHSSWQ